MPTITATPDPGTGTMLVQVEQTIGRDLFTRVVAGGWGALTTGQAWTVTGGVAGDYSVSGTAGIISNGSVGVARQAFYDTLSVDHDTTFSWTTPVAAPANGEFQSSVMVRFTDVNNYYFGQLSITAGGLSATFQIRRRVLGVNSDLTANVTLPTTHIGGSTYMIRTSACGSRIRGKAWLSTVAEPDWIADVTDTSMPSGTNTGVRSVLSSTVTNPLPVIWGYDNLVTIISQPVRVYRIVDGVYSEVRGSPLNTNQQTAAAASATATLWDNEGPFDVSTTYSLRSACTDTDLVTSTPVTLTADFGWLRDPTDPTRNIPLSEYAVYDPCEETDVVVFSGLGDPNYPTASGVFDIIGSQRPTTVSQTRKNYASSLALTSFSTDDLVDLEDLYAPGTILALSLPVEYGWAMRTSGTDYITIGDIEQAHVGRDQRVTARLWSMPFRLSDAPPDPSEPGTGGNGIGGGGATYDDLAASALGLTYNSLTASGQTYDQVAAGVGY